MAIESCSGRQRKVATKRWKLEFWDRDRICPGG